MKKIWSAASAAKQDNGVKVGSTTYYAASTHGALRGLRSVSVVVEPIEDDESNFPGLSTARVKSYTELALRRNGITVAPQPTSAKDLNIPALYVNINTMRPAFNIMINVQEIVTLNRRPTLGVVGAMSYLKATIGTGQDADFVLKGLGGLLEAFCNDFLQANPK